MLLIFIRIQKFKLNLCNDEFLEDKSMPRDEPKMPGYCSQTMDTIA